MEKDDVALIHGILSGDDKAFSILVEKYQKGIHALAWRKIGDFQIAEEIAQDAFLQAYKKLATLKKPDQFAGWLYVITSRLCTDWHRRKKPIMQSIEDTNKKVLDQNAYENYLANQREVAATEQRQDLVKRLLNKLPESERTVVTLHYLGEMTSDAISRLLGVSVNTIKSRLRRARNRLKEEEPMIRETLNNVQLSTNFTENVMEKIANIKPSPTSSGKPLLPWAAVCSAAVLIFCLLGASTRYQNRFSKPYDLESETEATIELVDSSVTHVNQSKPDNKRKIGNVHSLGVDSNFSKDDDVVLAADAQLISPNNKIEADPWTQVQGPESAEINELFVSTKGTLFAVSSTGVYRISDDNSGWIHMRGSTELNGYSKMPIAEWDEKLYITTFRGIYRSIDNGVNWKVVSSIPKGRSVELIINQDGFFLANEDSVFHTVGPGQSWKPLNNGLENKEITSMSSIGNTLFVGTKDGLYRLKAQTWHRLNADNIKSEVTMEVFKNKLYVATVNRDKFVPKTVDVIEGMLTRNSMNWKIFRSDDLGDSWENITPKSSNPLIRSLELNMFVSGETVLVISFRQSFRSRDGGKSWTNLGRVKDADGFSDSPVIAINENTFYKQGWYNLERSTDGGESWQKFMKGIVGSEIQDLVSYNNRLYAKTANEIVYSIDGGETWKPVRIDSGKGEDNYPAEFTVVNDTFYAIARDRNKSVHICQLSSDGTDLLPIPGLPAIGGEEFFKKLDDKENDVSERILESAMKRRNLPRIGTLAISKNTFYVVSNGRLFKATLSDSEWTDTEFDFEKSESKYGVEIAVSDKNIYVGRRDTHLIQSVDGGKNWKDITSDLPIQFKYFNDITFVDSSVYVATNEGTITSDFGKDWYVMTDNYGKNVVIDKFYIDDKNIYGIDDYKGVYRLEDQNKWKLISPKIREPIQNFTILDNKFYINTTDKGIFKIPIAR